MKECLKTILKATFDNNNLPILGFEKFKVPGGINLYANALGFTGRIVGNAVGCVVNPGQNTGNVDFSDDWMSLASTNEATGYLLYNITNSTVMGGIIELTNDIQKSSNILGLNIESQVGTTTGSVYHSTGDPKIIKVKYPNLKFLNMQSAEKMYGTVSEIFDELVHLEKLIVFNANNITGSLEELATSQISKGRTSGTLTIACNGVITYNGNVVGENVKKLITFSGSSYTVTDPA